VTVVTQPNNSDVIIGHDGKPRCGWAGAGDTPLGRYHDEVWGTRTYDESAMFEALTLGVFEVGLSTMRAEERG
jgi:DNA-3-methyladenine glycosylase I